MNEDRAIWPGNIFNIDRQRFLAAQAAIIDQPEQRTIARIGDLVQYGLDVLRI
jgi:hypothetical protein